MGDKQCSIEEADCLATIEAGNRLRERLEEPPPWKVIFLNDAVTTMAFVTAILMKLFGMDEARARVVMMQVHVEGSAVAEVCPYEVAETKAHLARQAAAEMHYPLRVVCEEA